MSLLLKKDQEDFKSILLFFYAQHSIAYKGRRLELFSLVCYAMLRIGKQLYEPSHPLKSSILKDRKKA